MTAFLTSFERNDSAVSFIFVSIMALISSAEKRFVSFLNCTSIRGLSFPSVTTLKDQCFMSFCTIVSL